LSWKKGIQQGKYKEARNKEEKQKEGN